MPTVQQVAFEIFPRSPPLSTCLENSLPSVGVSWENKALQNTSVILFTFPVLLALMVMNNSFFSPSARLLNCYLTPFYFKILIILQYPKNIFKIFWEGDHVAHPDHFFMTTVNLIAVLNLNLKFHHSILEKVCYQTS